MRLAQNDEYVEIWLELYKTIKQIGKNDLCLVQKRRIPVR